MSKLILLVLLAYFVIIFFVSKLVDRTSRGNMSFFTANKKSSWFIVSIGMIGASISGVTFISVPGMVQAQNMSYMQMVFGFIFGYLAVAYILLPLYYKLNLISIYEYLKKRFGIASYKTGASFFILSKIIGASAKLYIVAIILHNIIQQEYNIPFYATVVILVLFVWLYTTHSGVKTIIWTDMLQTLFLVLALVLIIAQLNSSLGFSLSDSFSQITANNHSEIFQWGNWTERSNFFKQFLGGILIVIVMTGLDQDMMQKNLTCRTLKDSQKNMLWYGTAFVPLNFLFLGLGILLLIFASQNNITLPSNGDQILPFLAVGYLGKTVLIFFVIGIVAASFSSIDSAITSVTTSVYVDVLNLKVDTKPTFRKIIHFGVSLLFIFTILIFHEIGSGGILNAIYKIASLTYGPLLGLFAFGMITKYPVRDAYVPFICILSPILCLAIEYVVEGNFPYRFGYEILLLNSLLTIMGLLLCKYPRTISDEIKSRIENNIAIMSK